MTDLCFGKLPARPNAITFKLSDFLSGTKVLRKAAAVAEFGHEEWSNPPISWGMYGNDRFGVCVLSGACHEQVLWAREGGYVLGFRDQDILRDFSAITGQPPSRDNGADMQMAASYRRRIGLLDADGKRRQIAAYLEIQPGNLNEIYYAIQNFGAAGIGWRVPSYAIDQFRARQSWHIISGGYDTGAGHYTPAFALRGGNLVTVSWARFQAMRPSFCAEFMDEGIVYVSFDILKGGKSPEGFDAQGLLARLAALPQRSTP